MIKYVTVLCVLAAVCAAAPQQNPQDVSILRYDNNVDVDGYQFSYETSDGTSRSESGKVDNPTSEDAALTVNGEFGYIAPDGKRVKVVFVAGPNGYQPKTTIEQKK